MHIDHISEHFGGDEPPNGEGDGMTGLLENDANQNQNGSAPDWLSAIVKLGVPSAIALALVWFLTQQVTAALTKVVDAIPAASAHYAHDQAVDTQEHTLTVLLQRICLNTAHNAQEREGCIWK